MGYLTSHARREQRVINGNGHFHIVWCTCPLCVAGLAAMGIADADWEIVNDSNPVERVLPGE